MASAVTATWVLLRDAPTPRAAMRPSKPIHRFSNGPITDSICTMSTGVISAKPMMIRNSEPNPAMILCSEKIRSRAAAIPKFRPAIDSSALFLRTPVSMFERTELKAGVVRIASQAGKHAAATVANTARAAALPRLVYVTETVWTSTAKYRSLIVPPTICSNDLESQNPAAAPMQKPIMARTRASRMTLPNSCRAVMPRARSTANCSRRLSTASVMVL